MFSDIGPAECAERLNNIVGSRSSNNNNDSANNHNNTSSINTGANQKY